jgi:hypothetical protein
VSDRARINEFTPDDEFDDDDIAYILRAGAQDISMTIKNAARRAAGIASGKSFTFDGTTGARVEMDGLVASAFRGLEMAWVSTTSFSVATGFVGDSTFADTLALRSSLTKTTSAWAVGTSAGGLDTGTIAANTWYAVHLIKRPDTGVVDVLFSLSDTAPTLPANYTLFRRIGWVLTNGSSQFVKFFQINREFWWDVKFSEVNEVTPASTNRILVTARAPKNSVALLSVSYRAGGQHFMDVGWTALADAAASATNFVVATNTSGNNGSGQVRVPIDASRQFYYRVTTLAGPATVSFTTDAYIDNL